jgi:hypothetical protein
MSAEQVTNPGEAKDKEEEVDYAAIFNKVLSNSPLFIKPGATLADLGVKPSQDQKIPADESDKSTLMSDNGLIERQAENIKKHKQNKISKFTGRHPS